MSIAEQIMLGTQQQSKNWSVLSENLGRLGQQVGQQLAMREYQKQAAEALPAMQAAYKSAMDDVAAGQVTEGYKKFMDAQFQFGGSQNPLIANQNALVSDFFIKAADTREKQLQRQAQYGGGGGTSGGGVGGSYYDVESALELPTSQDIQTPTGDVPIREGTELEAQYADEQPTQGYTTNILAMANSATPKFRDFLIKSAKNPPSEEKKQEAAQYYQQYEALPDDQKSAYRQGISIVVPTKKENEQVKERYGKFFFEFSPEQQKIMGDGITGVVLSPSKYVKSATEGTKGISRTSESTLKDILDYKEGVDGSLTQLEDARIVKFLEDNGGIFNIQTKEIGKKKIRDEALDQDIEIPETITIFPKNIDPEKITDPKERKRYELDITYNQLKAIRMIKGMPSRINNLRALNSDSSLVKVGAVGPTAEAAKGLPALRQPTQRPPIGSFFQRK